MSDGSLTPDASRSSPYLTSKCAQEMSMLEDDSNVYKLVGPLLVKQELQDARDNVTKRIDFIQGEL